MIRLAGSFIWALGIGSGIDDQRGE
jgi:hypothetical protein